MRTRLRYFLLENNILIEAALLIVSSMGNQFNIAGGSLSI